MNMSTTSSKGDPNQRAPCLQLQSPPPLHSAPSSSFLLCSSLSALFSFRLNSKTLHQATQPSMKSAHHPHVTNHVMPTTPAPYTSHKGSPINQVLSSWVNTRASLMACSSLARRRWRASWLVRMWVRKRFVLLSLFVRIKVDEEVVL